jgi:hypothetical protein
MAHSKLSNVCVCPAIVTVKALSYSLPQVSQRCIMAVCSFRVTGPS